MKKLLSIVAIASMVLSTTAHSKPVANGISLNNVDHALNLRGLG